MDPLITAVIIAWLVIRTWEAVKGEWRHTRDRHATDLAREHADWSPGRVRRTARHRARAYWWNEISAGFPGWKAGWAENRLVARLAAEKTLAGGHKRIRDLKQAIADVQAERKAAAEGDPAPAGPEPGTGVKPALTVLPGGREPVKGTAPEPPSPEPPPAAPEGPAEPATPEPPADGIPEPEDPGTVQPWSVQEDELLGAHRCIQRTGMDEDGPTYCAESTEDGRLYCPGHGGQPPGSSIQKTPSVTLGEPPTEGEHVTTAEADLEAGDSAYQAMLGFLNRGKAAAAAAASANCDAVDAAASATGLSRPPAVAAALAAVKDAEQAREAAYAGAARALAAHHEQGREYHEEGQGANREAFTAS